MGEFRSDFNVVRFVDKLRGGHHNHQDRELFNDMINHLGLIDMPINNRKYTWSNMGEPRSCQARQVFILDVWEARFSGFWIQAVPKLTLDHIPIYMFSKKDQENRKHIFRFEKCWL